MSYALDLTKYHFRQQHGDITIYGTWFERRPCLVLVPTILYRRPVPYVIPLERAWGWDEDVTADELLELLVGSPRGVVAMAANAAKSLGMDWMNRFTLMRIIGIIRDHVGDLLRMPPYPKGETEVVAEVEVRVNGQVYHREIHAEK